MRYLPLCILFTLFFSTPSAADSADGAKEFVSKLNREVVETLKSDSEWSDKEATLKALFLKSVDVKWIAKFVIGKYWRRAEDDEKTRYLDLYPDFSVSTYSDRFREYSGEVIKVKDAKSAGNNRYTVNTEIIRTNDANILITFHVWKKDGHMQIFDLVVEGVSMLNTQRSEFASIINRKGMSGLIEQLSQHTSKPE